MSGAFPHASTSAFVPLAPHQDLLEPLTGLSAIEAAFSGPEVSMDFSDIDLTNDGGEFEELIRSIPVELAAMEVDPEPTAEELLYRPSIDAIAEDVARLRTVEQTLAVQIYALRQVRAHERPADFYVRLMTTLRFASEAHQRSTTQLHILRSLELADSTLAIPTPSPLVNSANHLASRLPSQLSVAMPQDYRLAYTKMENLAKEKFQEIERDTTADQFHLLVDVVAELLQNCSALSLVLDADLNTRVQNPKIVVLLSNLQMSTRSRCMCSLYPSVFNVPGHKCTPQKDRIVVLSSFPLVLDNLAIHLTSNNVPHYRWPDTMDADVPIPSLIPSTVLMSNRGLDGLSRLNYDRIIFLDGAWSNTREFLDSDAVPGDAVRVRLHDTDPHLRQEIVILNTVELRMQKLTWLERDAMESWLSGSIHVGARLNVARIEPARLRMLVGLPELP